jgi:hypothetical protein
MEIEEYRPEPTRSVPPEPPRKDRSVVIMSLIFLMTFLVTLTVQERHQLADYARQHFAESPAPQAVQPSRAGNVLPSMLSGQRIQGNVERAMNCIPANMLSAAEIEQLNAAIAALPASSLGTTTRTLSVDSFDPHKMTGEQARETLQIVVQVKGPLGDKALQALNQSISEGPCKIRADIASFAQPGTQQPKPAPSPFL